jgi:dihydrofolate reductase
MGHLIVFNNISLDGYICDSNGDMSWAHSTDPEWNEFVSGNARGGGTLVFGRVTYDMMASYWPTPMAAQSMPEVAERMNTLPKVVFSRTMDKAAWQNTRLVKSDIVAEVRRMKKAGEEMAIMGSGSIVAQLAPEGVIDEYQVVVHPVVLGSGKTMFQGVRRTLRLKLKSSRTFKNGNVFACYEPAR